MRIKNQNSIVQITLILLIFTLGKFADVDIEAPSDVTVLTNENFDEILNSNELVFVKFYAPWCGHCKKMAPEYAELATEMINEKTGILIAKLNGDIHKKITERYSINGFPSLKLFKNGAVIEYKKDRTKNKIREWILEKKTQKPIFIDSVNDFEEYKKEKLSVVYVFPENDTKALKNFNDFILQYDDIPMAYSHNKSFAYEFGLKNAYSLIVIRNFDDGNKSESKGSFYAAKELTDLFTKFRFGAVMEMNSDSLEKINNEKKPTLVLFTNEKDTPLFTLLKDLSKNYKDSFNFMFSTLENESAKKMIENLAVKENNSIRLVGFANGKNQKYKPTVNTNLAVIELLENFKQGKAKQYMKSEAPPANNNQPVKIVVGANFNEVVIKNNNFVLLEAYAPWCGHCKNLEPIYNQLAIELLSIKNLTISKIEATANEHPLLKTESYPTILFFKPGKKDKPIQYKGERTLEAMKKYILKQMKIKTEVSDEL